MNLKYYTGIVLLLLGMQSCKEDKEPDYKDDNTENGWIYSVMKSNYLWQEGIPEYSETKKTLPATDDVKSLLSDNEKKDDYYYSFIEEKTKYKDTEITSSDGLSYGFQFVLTKSETNSYYARILHVLPGSSAEKAGLKRGMWILKIDDNAVTSSNY